MEKRTLSLGFKNRHDAGAALGKALLKRRDWQDPVVLAVPRGGVPVAAEVARALDAPLDVHGEFGDEPHVPLQDREVIVVDEGMDTGATMRAAVQAVRQQNPAHVTVAVPVGARESCEALGSVADEVVCVRIPEPFESIETWYAELPQVGDEEIRSLLTVARRRVAT